MRVCVCWGGGALPSWNRVFKALKYSFLFSFFPSDLLMQQAPQVQCCPTQGSTLCPQRYKSILIVTTETAATKWSQANWALFCTL